MKTPTIEAKTSNITFRGHHVTVRRLTNGRVEYWTKAAALLLCSEADRAEMRRLAGL